VRVCGLLSAVLPHPSCASFLFLLLSLLFSSLSCLSSRSLISYLPHSVFSSLFSLSLSLSFSLSLSLSLSLFLCLFSSSLSSSLLLSSPLSSFRFSLCVSPPPHSIPSLSHLLISYSVPDSLPICQYQNATTTTLTKLALPPYCCQHLFYNHPNSVHMPVTTRLRKRHRRVALTVHQQQPPNSDAIDARLSPDLVLHVLDFLENADRCRFAVTSKPALHLAQPGSSSEPFRIGTGLSLARSIRTHTQS
jgi:hypothetical protein